MKTLVTGGIRSGKSAYAESLFGDQPAVYIATGATRDDDAAWVKRIRAHQERRSAMWETRETVNVLDVLGGSDDNRPVLIDDLGHWLSRTLDEVEAWDAPEESWRPRYDERRETLLEALTAPTPRNIVIVSGEVGFGLVSPYSSGRLYTDELGTLNQKVAALCDVVTLVVAGCPVVVKPAPQHQDPS